MANISPNVILPSLLLLFLFLIHTTLSLPLLPITSTNQTQVYIVHVQHPDGPIELLPPDDRESWYHSFLPNNTLDYGEPRMIHTYSVAMSGFAARLTPDEVRVMESMPGFLFAHIDKPFHLRTTRTPALLGLDQYNSLWQQSSKGEGIIIGVLDSGITPDHPSFADPGLPIYPVKWRGRCNLPAGFSCTNKLIGAQEFTHKGKKTSIDEKGHGTHVAAIAAGTPVPDASVLGQARGTASGMAPRAHIASYKVCKPGSCSNGNLIKGFDQAIIDGVDLIQISVGSENSDYSRNGVVIGSFSALKHGILTVNSAGNSGPSKSILDNDVPWILHVGAASIDRRVTAVLKLGNGMEFVGMSGYQPNPSTAVDLPIVYPGVKKTQETLTCQNGSMAGFDVVGKMVLCGTGYIDKTKKAEIVKAAGGAAIIVVNQPWEGYTLNADPYCIPAIHLPYTDFVKILNYYENDHNATGTITFKGTEYGIRPSPTVACFSSRGPSLLNGGILKPDVIAPGVNILSAWPFKVGTGSVLDNSINNTKNFFMESGTSMAAPHVSGIAALLKKIHPNWSPAAIKSAIMTTAYIVDRDGGPIIDDESKTRANVFAVGAGHINPTAANDPGLVYDVTDTDYYIPYLCSLKGYFSAKVTRIVNKFVTCSGKKMGAEEVNYPSIQVSMGSAGAKKSVQRTVKNVGVASSTYTANVVEPSGVKVVVIPETLNFSNIGEEQNFTVELSLTGKGQLNKDDVLEGRIKWVSGNREVSSPIVITA